MDTKYIVKNGVKRIAVEVICDYCGIKFLKEKRFISERNYCSPGHSAKGRQKRIIVECAYCGKEIERTLSSLDNSKSGLYFCNLEHKNLAQKKQNGLFEIWPEHYKDSYIKAKTKAFRFYEHKCESCGYDQHKEVLQVYYIDGNIKNLSIDNLIILCPTCAWAVINRDVPIKGRKLLW